MTRHAEEANIAHTATVRDGIGDGKANPDDAPACTMTAAYAFDASLPSATRLVASSGSAGNGVAVALKLANDDDEVDAHAHYPYADSTTRPVGRHTLPILSTFVFLVWDLLRCVVPKWMPVAASSVAVALAANVAIRAVSDRTDWVLSRCAIASTEYVFFLVVISIMVAVSTSRKDAKIPPVFMQTFTVGAVIAAGLLSAVLYVTGFLRDTSCSAWKLIWVCVVPPIVLYAVGNLPLLWMRELLPPYLRTSRAFVVVIAIAALATAQAIAFVVHSVMTFVWFYVFSGVVDGHRRQSKKLEFVYGSVAYPVLSQVLVSALLALTKSGNVEPAFHAIQIRVFVFAIKLPERSLQYCAENPFAGLVISTLVSAVVKDTMPILFRWAKATGLPRLQRMRLRLCPARRNHLSDAVRSQTDFINTEHNPLHMTSVESAERSNVSNITVQLSPCSADVGPDMAVGAEGRFGTSDSDDLSSRHPLPVTPHNREHWLGLRKLNELIGRHTANVCGVAISIAVCDAQPGRAVGLGVFGVALMVLADAASLFIAFAASSWYLTRAVDMRARVQKVGNIRASVVILLQTWCATGVILAAESFCDG
eukprot:Opistho-2@17799